MTKNELIPHYIATLLKHPGHTIVKHKRPSGGTCYRIRDAKVNPVDNIPESVFNHYIENDIVFKLNDREWRLNPSQK